MSSLNCFFQQYLFSEETVEFVLNTLEAKGITHILCVGCPRLVVFRLPLHFSLLKKVLLSA